MCCGCCYLRVLHLLYNGSLFASGTLRIVTVLLTTDTKYKVLLPSCFSQKEDLAVVTSDSKLILFLQLVKTKEYLSFPMLCLLFCHVHFCVDADAPM